MIAKKEIIKLLKLTASLMEIHGENEFKTRVYTNASFNLDRYEGEIAKLSKEELEKIDGLGKSMVGSIQQIIEKGTFDKLEDLLSKTPEGVLDIMDIKGLGAKKVRVLWKDLNITTLEDLKTACETNQIAAIKGFGQKTQENILSEINYILANKSKLLYSDAENLAEQIGKVVTENNSDILFSVAGEVRRKMEIVDMLSFVIGTDDIPEVYNGLNKIGSLHHQKENSGPLNWRGVLNDRGTKVEFVLCQKDRFYNKLILHTGSEMHLANAIYEGDNLFSITGSDKLKSEQSAYEKLSMQFVEPELREGWFEIEMAKENTLPELVQFGDLKGTLHNHSTYSDGKNSLREMAEKCIELNYEYLGISDHSQSAFYANGLSEFEIKKQHEEIDLLNEELAPRLSGGRAFKIFKGIESDILNDGSLDYSDDVLGSFDFIVASVHSNLNMDISKATHRLLTAIKNPYTTILGHSTGRLLLRREGYPIDHKAIIEACAEHDVIIEINANPWRLDLDWRWVHYAIEAGITLSVNPDAHETEGFKDMYYGIQGGRKGGVTKEKTFNCRSLKEIENYFKSKKEKKINDK